MIMYFVVIAIVEQGLLRFYDAIIQGVIRHFNFEGKYACAFNYSNMNNIIYRG